MRRTLEFFLVGVGMVTTISNSSEFEITAEVEWSVGAMTAVCVSFLAGAILAAASVALWMIEVLEGRSFRTLEVCFPVASFFLFITGAHFLDRIDARKAKGTNDSGTCQE